MIRTGLFVVCIVVLLVVCFVNLFLGRKLYIKNKDVNSLMDALLDSPNKRSVDVSYNDAVKFIMYYSYWVRKSKIPAATGVSNYHDHLNRREKNRIMKDNQKVNDK